jgi:uncharacterized protein (DUF697 family)
MKTFAGEVSTVDSKENEATDWVNGYTATAVGIVAAVAGIPGAGTATCIGIETAMCFHIGAIYDCDMTWEIAGQHALKIGLGTIGAKLVLLELATLTGPFAYVIKPTIAAPIVNILGRTVINYYKNM